MRTESSDADTGEDGTREQGPAPPPADERLAAGDALGRFRIERELGAGGMGRVYAAHDPELERTVAVKLLRDAGWSTMSDRTRFMREARAMARLRHPNVITIHEVGEDAGRPYIAMELLEGPDLAAWLKTPRGWREIRDVFMAAGRGLAAAHAAGLVHRDFKPSNVLCGEAGVRVADFGLATRAEEPAEEPIPSSQTDVALTRTGALVGTVPYMAPEQLVGERATERSDQWSFCVALHEALYGKRPFIARGPEAVLKAIHAGAALPAGPPRFLVRLLRRGLALDPAARYPSMAALLHDLGRDPGRRLRWAAAGLAVAAAAGAALALRPRPAAPCQDARGPYADVWRSRLRPRLLDQAQAQATPAARAVGDQVVKMLDGYAGRFGDAAAGICRATYVARSQSEGAFEAQTECLRRLGRRFELITEQLLAPGSLVGASRVAGRLEEPADCAAVTALGHAAPRDRPRREALTRTLDEARVDLDLGHVRAGDDKLAAAATEAQALGDQPLAAETQLLEAQARLALGKDDEARRLLDEAVATALGAQEPILALRGYMLMVSVLVHAHRPAAEAEQPARMFRWLAARTGLGGRYEPRLLADLAALAQDGHDAAAAEALLRQGLAHTDLGTAFRAELRLKLGYLLTDAGKLDEAGATLDAALTDAVAAYGEDSAVVINVEQARAYLAFARGGAAAALPAQERLVGRIERFGMEQPRFLLDAQHNLIAYLLAVKQDQRALELARRAAALAAQALPEGDATRAVAETTLANTLLDFDRAAEALPILEKLRASVDPDERAAAAGLPMPAAMIHFGLARAQRRTDAAAALRHLRRARAILEPVRARPDIKAIEAEMDDLERELTGGRRP